MNEKDFMETPAMKRLISAEHYLIITGRFEEYKGKTIQEELKSLLDAERAELVREVEKVREYPHHSSHVTYGDTEYNNHAVVYGINQALDTVIEKIKNK